MLVIQTTSYSESFRDYDYRWIEEQGKTMLFVKTEAKETTFPLGNINAIHEFTDD